MALTPVPSQQPRGVLEGGAEAQRSAMHLQDLGQVLSSESPASCHLPFSSIEPYKLGPQMAGSSS